MKTRRIEIKWGILFSIMGLVWMMLEKAVGLHDEHIDKHMVYTNLIAIPAIAIYIMALMEKRRKDYGGSLIFKQGFVSGLFITLVATILSPLTQYITSTFITPDYFANATAYVIEVGMMTEEEASSYFNLKNYMIQGLVYAPVMGILTSVIVAFAVKRTPK